MLKLADISSMIVLKILPWKGCREEILWIEASQKKVCSSCVALLRIGPQQTCLKEKMI